MSGARFLKCGWYSMSSRVDWSRALNSRAVSAHTVASLALAGSERPPPSRRTTSASARSTRSLKPMDCRASSIWLFGERFVKSRSTAA
eukprot:scaffold1177_cov126-Isochrysis_galbana.AAC.10